MYSIGEVAKETGVTIRALRYYDEINLLKPSAIVNGRRYYDIKDIEKLQKITTFKYLGFSLEDIEGLLNKNDNFKEALIIQSNMMKKKKLHLNLMLDVMNETIDSLENEKNVDISSVNKLIQLVNIEKDWTFQFEKPDKLDARINIHSLYSTAKKSWYTWYFENILKEVKGDSIEVLELACGDGRFLASNKDVIPKSWKLTESDISLGMLKAAEENFKDIENEVNFKFIDAESIKEDRKYDVIIGNHFLFYVGDVAKALEGIKRTLKDEGIFFTSTVGENHMKEIGDLVKEFDNTMELNTKKPTEKFGLQNGEEFLKLYFNKIHKKIHENSLFVTIAEDLVSYILSIPFKGSDRLVGKTLEEFKGFIQNKIDLDGGIYITKETGFFVCK